MTYPLIGNYGVPGDQRDELGLLRHFESERIQVTGLVVSKLASDTSHWTAQRSLHDWLHAANIPGIADIDTRDLATKLREKGSMLGKLLRADEDLQWHDPNVSNLVAQVSINKPISYGTDGPRIVLVDCGAKESIIRGLVRAGARVLRVPWNYDFFDEPFDGILVSNGPGDPKMADTTVANVRRAIEQKIPLFGVCMGNQILALAAGADTYKLKFGHRSQNQPCIEVGTKRCFITSQNHGYAVRAERLPEGWREWFVNANDNSNEGIRHDWKPIRSVQFHPEARPGPTDTRELFRRFVEMMR
jgi:carbamoyl-phosphate synthase small subunit